MKGILALGNPLRGDDAVGIYAGKLLEKRGFSVVFGFETPENLKLEGFSELIILDAAHFDEDSPIMIGKAVSGSYTNKPGLDKIAKYLKVPYTLIGIKTYNRRLGESLSDKARGNALAAVRVIEVCMAVPGVVVNEKEKTVNLGAKVRQVKFAVPNLKKGDFVLVHAGVVIDTLSKEDYLNAKEALSGILSCE